jgi:sulfonate transport system substrate-binding protein
MAGGAQVQSKVMQVMPGAILSTLKWIHSHSPEEIMAKMPPAMVGKNQDLYLAAVKNTLPMYSTTGTMDSRGARAVLAVFSQSSPAVAKAKIDLPETHTNKYVDAANEKMGTK